MINALFFCQANISTSYVDERQVNTEEQYDGFYAVCTNLDDDPEAIVKVNKRRWEIEECFRIMKSDFEARPVYVKRQVTKSPTKRISSAL